jgi:hypothetical protein
MTARTLRRRVLGSSALAVLASGALIATVPGTASAQQTDPRQGLTPSTSTAASPELVDGGVAAQGLDKLGNAPTGTWTPPLLPMNGSNVNSDLAFFGDHAVMGNYQGFSIYDVKDAASPTLRTTVTCPGSQNDVSVYGDLLFLSVEQTTARVDCGAGTNPARFQGVRIFDISDLDNPQQVHAVQTCRGSHTHTVVTKPGVDDKIWIYVSATNAATSRVTAGTANHLPGCTAGSSNVDPNTGNFRIDVIEVPLDEPETAAVVSNPRIFSKCGSSECEGDFATVHQHPIERYNVNALGGRGTLNWLNQPGVQPTYPADSGRAPGGQSVSQSSACHDITAYPAIGLAAGACQGDGLLLDISDPVNPVRIDNVTDNNFAYWHSATFNNDGTKVIFTDEWGGGSGARCRATDPTNWGVDAIFDIVQTETGPKMEFASYFGIPKVQSPNENCVAHNGNLVPVPGRDIMVQAWYQGGVSVWDFTDSANPTEIAFFDRGPVVTPTSPTAVALGGYWSTYWNNGRIIGSDIRRGLDSFDLTASALTSNQLAAAKAVRTSENNVQHQEKIVWPASFTTVRGFYDSAVQRGQLSPAEQADVTRFLDRAEGFAARNKTSARATLNAKAGELTAPEQQPLADAMRQLAGSL